MIESEVLKSYLTSLVGATVAELGSRVGANVGSVVGYRVPVK